MAKPRTKWAGYWKCECGETGDATTIKYTVTDYERIALQCPKCGRRPLPSSGPGNRPGPPPVLPSEPALTLRKQGLTYRQIGKQLGCSHEGARRAVKRGEVYEQRASAEVE